MEEINKKQLRKLMYVLGFIHAPEWDDLKLREMGVSLAENVQRQDIPERYQQLYDRLRKYNKSGEMIRWEVPK